MISLKPKANPCQKDLTGSHSSFTFLLLVLAFLTLAFSITGSAPVTGVNTEILFNEGTGTTAADGSGNGHTGTLTNGPTWGPGKYGQAVNLDGVNDYVNIADHNDYTLDPTLSYTWSGWVKNNSFKEWSTVWSQTINSSNFFYFYAHTSTDPDGGPVTNGISVYWWVNNGASKLGVHSNNNVLTAGQWSYVAITYDGSQAQNNRFTIYVNGTDVTARNDIASVGTITTINPTNIRIGSNQPFGEYLNGSVDEVRYYRRLLTPAEMLTDMNTGATGDTQAPVVSLSSPLAGATVSGLIPVNATATDNVRVAGVQFLLDGATLGAEDTVSPYTTNWNSLTATNGTHSLTARARDAAGNQTVSAAVSVTVNNPDTIPPVVSINAPLAGTTISGSVNLSATASDNIGVVGVQFLVDGTNSGAEDISSPYGITLNSLLLSNGSHTITARARDAAGNITTSTPVTVSVLNISLVAAFGFNENTGTIANDNSGNGNNGTLTNGPLWSASGKYGAAVSFDGVNDIININDANSLDLTSGMTLEAWVNPSNLTGYKTVISKENGTNNLAYAMSANNSTSGAANQRPNSRIRIGTSTKTVTGTAKLAANTWTHIASTYDGTTLRYFVNGVQVSSLATTGNITTTTNLLRIGGNPALGSEYFTGLIDEVRIYNRALSQSEIQLDMNTPIAPDITPPVVSITAPLSAAVVSGTLNVTAAATDNIAVVGVQFYLDGNPLSTEDLSAPYSVSWGTLTATNGNHVLTAKARDAAGNATTSAPITVSVNNDTQVPVISISSPVSGATISGTTNLTASASDNVGVIGVQFLLDGNNLGSEFSTTPYTLAWNSTSVADGSHVLTAKARDSAGNVGTSAAVNVQILNTIPDTIAPVIAIITPDGSSPVAGTINVTANASDNIGVTGVQFLLDGQNLGTEDLTSPFSVPWNTSQTANGTHTISAKARDAAGNTSTAATIQITVNNDTQPPTVNLSSPAPGPVSGTVNITADASDNVAVAAVQFLLDGNPLGTEDSLAPYAYSWNTSSISNGNHLLSAKARDAAGNSTLSSTVSVTVSNIDTILPLASITSPAANATLFGTVTVAANATDNIGVVGVQLFVDGGAVNAELLAPPYNFSWNTLSVVNGAHIITVKARDAAGNYGVSTDLPVNINNDTQSPTVSITAPANGAVITGTVNLTAASSDNIGVVGVQFLLNGANLGIEQTSAPYSLSWNSTSVANGNYTIAARARDAAGNTAIATGITLVVNNNTGLISAHAFNEGTGTAASDVSGNSHNGVLTNGPLWVAGKYGQAISFDGVNDYVNIADHADFTLDPTQSYTWSAWVKNASFREWSPVWSQTLNTSNFFYFYAHTSTDPDGGPVTNGVSVYWWVNNGASKLGAHSANNVLTLGQWSHITVTYNGSQPQNNRFSIYVNGVDVTVRTDIASVGTITSINPTNIRIGADEPFAEYLNGSIDEVRFYKRLLSATEIVTDMNTPIGADNVPPVVSVTSPANGATVSSTINVVATASDNVGIAGVQFFLDGVALGAEDLTIPYSATWVTTGSANGSHTLTAKARDLAGNTTMSAASIAIVSNIPDTIAPTVSISSPAPGNVSGIVTVNVTAADNIAVAGVKLQANGLNVGSELLSPPYSFAWNTSSIPNGNYSLTAIARDSAGNSTVSLPIAVTVTNIPDTTAPTIVIASPLAGNVVGTVNINATVTDNVGVVGVQFLLDGAALGTEVLTAPFSIQWNSGLVSSGTHVLSARARDAAGNTSLAPNVTVTVVAGSPPVITAISVSSITNTSAVINWTTNVPANSQLNYGTSTAYGLISLTDPTLVLSHSMILYGLTPGTNYHYQILTADVNSILSSSGDNTFNVPALPASIGGLNNHNVQADAGGKIIPWMPNPAMGYDSVIRIAWNYLLNQVPNDPSTGKPAYYSRSLLDAISQAVVDWPHNPAGLYGMMIESAQKFFIYSGNIKVMQQAEAVGLWHLDHGMTLAADSWASVPYASGDAGSLTYAGAAQGNVSGQGDGTGYLQPDKIGELANGWLKLYEYDGNTRFRDAAIQAADVLSSKVRTGTASQSPWPFRVNAHDGSVREDYCANIIGCVSLFDGLIAHGLGNTAAYQAARTKAWTWLMTYPMVNNVWAQYFEDVATQAAYNTNVNQYDALMTARYLLEHPESDASWESHVRGIISWVETNFGQAGFGATAIKEQQPVFGYVMGSHTSRYASVNALLYEKTGDLAAKEKAYRSFNWATYMANPSGVIIDGPDVNTLWFTDGYCDYVRHFMTGMGAVPEWSPASQTHLLRTSSVVKTITYGTGLVTYTTFDSSSIEVLHVNFNPAQVTVDGQPLLKRSDLTQAGWTLDVATKTIRIYHTSGTQVVVSAGGPASRMNVMDPMYTQVPLKRKVQRLLLPGKKIAVQESIHERFARSPE